MMDIARKQIFRYVLVAIFSASVAIIFLMFIYWAFFSSDIGLYIKGYSKNSLDSSQSTNNQMPAASLKPAQSLNSAKSSTLGADAPKDGQFTLNPGQTISFDIPKNKNIRINTSRYLEKIDLIMDGAVKKSYTDRVFEYSINFIQAEKGVSKQLKISAGSSGAKINITTID